jgi:hypothetical protein
MPSRLDHELEEAMNETFRLGYYRTINLEDVERERLEKLKKQKEEEYRLLIEKERKDRLRREEAFSTNRRIKVRRKQL